MQSTDGFPVCVLFGDEAVPELPKIATEILEWLAFYWRAADDPFRNSLALINDPVAHFFPAHVGDLLIAGAQHFTDLNLADATPSFGCVWTPRHQPLAIVGEMRENRLDVLAVKATLNLVQ